MVAIIVYIALLAAVLVSFWSSLVEATFLTLRPFSLSSSIDGGSAHATKALAIVNEKTRLVSATTFLDTMSNVVLASAMGLILSDYFGPIGWVYSAVAGSLVIMVFLYLLPKAIGIENALRMSISLAPGTMFMMNGLAPLAVPLTTLARGLSERLVGKPGYREVDLVDEFEDVVAMLEKAGHIEPDAGRLLRTALASSKNAAADSLTPVEQIVSVTADATILDALKAMGRTGHPRMPVYDQERQQYVGAVTFRTMSKAVGRDLLEARLTDYMVQPAKVGRDEGLASVMEKMQDAGTAIAFVYDGTTMIGMVTLSDIIEQLLGIKV